MLIFYTISTLLSQSLYSHGQLPNRTVLCGPKCIDNILKYYGLQTLDIVEISKQMEHFDFTNGSRLDAISKYLNDSGVYTKLIKTDRHACIKWPFPAIVHLEMTNGSKHFVVWYPPDEIQPTNSIKIFDGRSSMRMVSNAEWTEMKSGYVLLTSPTLIPDEITPVKSVDASAFRINPRLAFITLLFGIGTLYFGVRRKRLYDYEE